MTGGLTPGKAAMGLELRHRNVEPIAQSPGQMPKLLSRHTIGYLCIDVLLLGCLNALRDAHRRPVHDYVLGYQVVADGQAPARLPARATNFWNNWEAGEELLRQE